MLILVDCLVLRIKILQLTFHINHNFKQKVKQILSDFFLMNIIFLLIMIVLRITESINLYLNHALNVNYFKTFIFGSFQDLLLVLVFSAGFFFAYLIVALMNRKIASIIYKTLFLIIILLQFFLIRYFFNTLILLDQSILEFSFKEIFYITEKEITSFNFLSIIIFLVFAIAVYFGFKKIKFRTPLFFSFTYIILSFTAIFIPDLLILDKDEYKNEIEFFLASNKISYLGNEIYKSKNAKTIALDEIALEKAIEYYHQQNKNNEFTEKIYPFYRKQSSENCLGEYFQKSSQKPNLVFLIVESLSRSFSGPNANYKSFTPFLDSLTNKSLYWENFTSNAQRSYGALPNIFASLPNGTSRGIINMGKDIPIHESLIKLANENDYFTRFFYGGWISFDKMDIFMENQNVDYALDYLKFGDKYQMINKNKDGLTWGYPDKALFQKSFEIIDKANSNHPYLSIYFTLSIHHPFICDNQEYYKQQFEEMLEQNSFDEKTKNRYKKYSNVYETILYDDDALRGFFNSYKNRPEFNNTIFIITGDHNIGQIPVKNNIDKYHVPLIIFSPLLTQYKHFKGVSSHLDITPSLIPLLKDNFGLQFPKMCSWLGKGLDTTSCFQNRNAFPFSNASEYIKEYFSGDYYLVEDKLYKVSDNMNIIFEDNQEIKDSLTKCLDVYNTLNKYVCHENMILPIKYFAENYNFNETIKTSSSFDSFVGNLFHQDNDISDKYFKSGNGSLHIRPDQKFSFPISENIEAETISLIFEISFFIRFDEYNADKIPSYVISINEKDSCIFYESIKFGEKINTDIEWNKIRINSNIRISKGQKERKLSMYFYNTKKSEFYIDDFECSVYSSKRNLNPETHNWSL